MSKKRFKLPKYLNSRLLFTLFSAAFIIGGTYLAIRYARGQRPTSGGIVRDTGLLVANSFPTAAQVYINDKLVTATDDTLNLDPGEYLIEIKKDGYIPWRKTMTLKKELVSQTNALLFPSAPSLSPITVSGAENIVPAPDGQKIVFYTASASAQSKNGLYLTDLTGSPLSLQRGPKQIALDSNLLDLGDAEIIWSPDSTEIMITDGNRYRLLDLDSTQDLDTMTDVSLTANQTLSAWEEEMYLRERQILAKFPPEMVKIATESAKNVYFSPDGEKMMYTATEAAELPPDLVSAPPSVSTQPEVRQLQPLYTYIYDRIEDKNFQIGTPENNPASYFKTLLATDLSRPALTLEASPSAFTRLQATTSAQTQQSFLGYHSGLFSGKLQWYPDSNHLIRISDNHLSILEYDGTNEVVVYAGPFDRNFVYPWSNGDKLLIKTSFNQPDSAPLNLYAIQLK